MPVLRDLTMQKRGRRHYERIQKKFKLSLAMLKQLYRQLSKFKTVNTAINFRSYNALSPAYITIWGFLKIKSHCCKPRALFQFPWFLHTCCHLASGIPSKRQSSLGTTSSNLFQIHISFPSTVIFIINNISSNTLPVFFLWQMYLCHSHFQRLKEFATNSVPAIPSVQWFPSLSNLYLKKKPKQTIQKSQK